MLLKIFGARKLALIPIPTPTPIPIPIPTPIPIEDEEERSSVALKIIHAGGLVELYYMAVPAAKIIDKYPSFMLARPDVFRRPWDAIVAPEEILTPGQKYFLVPPRTVKKLRRRIKKQSGNGTNSSLVLATSQSGIVASSLEEMSSNSSKSSFAKNRFAILMKSKSKIKTSNHRVRFFGIDIKQNTVSSRKNKNGAKNNDANKSQNPQHDRKKRRGRNIVQWQPSLTSITEDH